VGKKEEKRRGEIFEFLCIYNLEIEWSLLQFKAAAVVGVVVVVWGNSSSHVISIDVLVSVNH